MFRSAAAARLAGLPVATLRIWEQRYQAVHPRTAPSGHRLYSQADIRRIQLLRKLTQQGHAIGSLAGLDNEALQRLADDAPLPDADTTLRGLAARPALRLVVVGPAFAARLQRPALMHGLPQPLRLLAVHDTLTEAAANASAGSCDLLVWHTPALNTEDIAAVKAAQAALGAAAVAVVYRFGNTAAQAALLRGQVLLLRDPPDDEALGAWFAALRIRLANRPGTAPPPHKPASALSPPAPRRYDDAQLTAIAGLSSALACECPRHVAELLMQLSSFEAYSGSCQHRSPGDAALHTMLQQVAARSRALFEEALERVAQHEGLALTPAAHEASHENTP